MALNIKNPEAQKLAQKLARLTGESKTAAVTEALRERLHRLSGEEATGLATRLLEIGKQCAARLRGPSRNLEHGEFLYDEKGLPK